MQSSSNRKQSVLWALRALLEFSPVDEEGNQLEEVDEEGKCRQAFQRML